MDINETFMNYNSLLDLLVERNTRTDFLHFLWEEISGERQNSDVKDLVKRNNFLDIFYAFSLDEIFSITGCNGSENLNDIKLEFLFKLVRCLSIELTARRF